MARETERSIEALYRDDRGADAVSSSRRGFLGGTGLAAMGAIVRVECRFPILRAG